MKRLQPFLRRGVLAIMLCLAGLPSKVSDAHAHISSSLSSGRTLYFGLVYPASPDVSTLQRYETELGQGAAVVLWYQDWVESGHQQPFPAAQMDAVRLHGSIPMLAWYPEDGAVSSFDQPNFTLSRIIDGTWDPYLRQYASAVKAWGHPFFLRFASEMNGNWTPWSETTNGNTLGQYARAWRHVHDIFVAVGATNATWTWCPNNEDPHYTPLADLYPGDSYVDWACIDGYNFSSDLSGAPWRSFTQIFGATYQHLLTLIPPTMPIIIGETGSVEHGGSKPGWITDALTVQLPAHYPRIAGLVWFNSTNPGIDLRFDTSPQALAAFRAALSLKTYTGNVYRFLDQSPIPYPENVAQAASKPLVVHANTGPAPGHIQVLDSHGETPVPDAVLTFAGGEQVAADDDGVAVLPTSQGILQRIALPGGAIAANVVLNSSAGYEVQLDLASGTLTRVLVHELPGQESGDELWNASWLVVLALGALGVIIWTTLFLYLRSWVRGRFLL